MIGAEDRRLAIILLSLAGTYLFTLLPFPSDFPPEAVTMMGIAIVGALFWITESLPIALTGLVIIVLQALYGIQPISDGLAYIATPVNSIVFAGFIMASAFSKYGLDRRVGLMIVSAMGERTDRLLLGIMVSTALLSMWISNSAATAIMLPIALGVLKMNDVQPGGSNLGRSMMLGIAAAANIGGMGTPAGTPACSITIALIAELTGHEIRFLDWFLRAFPIVVILTPVAWRLLLLVYPAETDRIQGGLEAVRRELRDMGPLTGGQKHVLILFVLSLLLWTADSFLMLPSGWLYIASTLIALMFVAPRLGAVRWEDASRNIGWGIFILVGGGLALGSGLNQTGVVHLMAERFSAFLGHSSGVVIVTSLAMITAMSITFFSSLTATATTFVPMAVGLGYQLGLDPVMLAMVAGLSSCLAFLLPANTPPNAIAYAMGYFKTHEMLKVGLLLTVASILILSLTANLFWTF